MPQRLASTPTAQPAPAYEFDQRIALYPRPSTAVRSFGERQGVAVWCAYPGGEHLRSQSDRGCAFWQREPGSAD